ncbi:hypothetical protein AOLI_G00148390 [Acnodon oligacanthus]
MTTPPTTVITTTSPTSITTASPITIAPTTDITTSPPATTTTNTTTTSVRSTVQPPSTVVQPSTPAAQLVSTPLPTNFTAVAAAIVKMRSFTELSNDTIVVFIEELARQIQARINGTIKITVKKIMKVAP